MNDNEPATHREPFGIHKDKRNRNVDMETLKQHIDSDRNHVELLLKSGRTWVPFYGRAERADFWNSLYGDGTKETPFFVRIPGDWSWVISKGMEEEVSNIQVTAPWF